MSEVIQLSANEVSWLAASLSEAAATHTSVKVWVDEYGAPSFKVKLFDRWSPPLGELAQ